MVVKQSDNGTWFTQCKDKFGNEVHKCKRGFSTPEEAQAWEEDFIASAGCTMAMTFGEFFQVYAADVRPRLREHTWRQKEYTIKSLASGLMSSFLPPHDIEARYLGHPLLLEEGQDLRWQRIQPHLPKNRQQSANRNTKPRGALLRT